MDRVGVSELEKNWCIINGVLSYIMHQMQVIYEETSKEVIIVKLKLGCIGCGAYW